MNAEGNMLLKDDVISENYRKSKKNCTKIM